MGRWRCRPSAASSNGGSTQPGLGSSSQTPVWSSRPLWCEEGCEGTSYEPSPSGHRSPERRYSAGETLWDQRSFCVSPHIWQNIQISNIKWCCSFWNSNFCHQHKNGNKVKDGGMNSHLFGPVNRDTSVLTGRLSWTQPQYLHLRSWALKCTFRCQQVVGGCPTHLNPHSVHTHTNPASEWYLKTSVSYNSPRPTAPQLSSFWD